MTFLDSLRGRFGRTAKRAPELPPYSIDHNVVDEIVHKDLVAESARVRQRLETPFTIQRDGRWEDYAPSRDLKTDLFLSSFTHTEPRVRDREEIRPADHLNAEIMRELVKQPDFKAMRAYTRGDKLASEVARMKMTEAAQEALRQLPEQAQQANDADQAQQQAEQAQQAIDELRQQAQQHVQQGQPVPDELAEQMREKIKERTDAQGTLAQIAEQIDANAQEVQAAAALAAEKAAEAGREAAEAWGQLPGNGRGDPPHDKPDDALALAEVWCATPNMRKLSELIGRFKRDFRAKASQNVIGGSEAIVGVEQGNDLTRILPGELAQLGHAIYHRKFLRDFVDENLLQYEMVGYAQGSRGPGILLLDLSSSMSEQKILWAKAVTIAVGANMLRDSRDFIVIGYNSAVVKKWEFRAGGRMDLRLLTDLASVQPRGGTNITTTLIHAETLIGDDATWEKADIVVTTDGQSHLDPDVAFPLRDRLRERGVRLTAVLIRAGDTTPYTAAMCDEEIAVADLTAPSSATDRLVKAVA